MPGSEVQDIYLENESTSTEMGFLLVKNPETKTKTYLHTSEEKKIPAQKIAGVQQGETPQGRMLRWIIDSYHCGTGFKTYVTQRHLKKTNKVDLRSFGRAYVLPDSYQSNLNATTKTPKAWAMWDSKLFMALGATLYEASSDCKTWTNRGTTTNGDITSIVSADTVLLLADGKLWTWNGAALAEHATIDADGIYITNSAYRTTKGYEIRSCPCSEDPTVAANWADWVAVGEADKPIKHVVNFNGGTFACKADGIYKLEDDGDVIKIWDSYGVAYESCDYAILWNGNLVFDVGTNGIFLITPAEEVIDISMQAWCDMEHHDVVNIGGLAPMGDYLIAVIEGSWDATYPSTQHSLWIGWQTREGGQVVWRWQELFDDIGAGIPHWWADRIIYRASNNYIVFTEWLLFPHRLERAADRTYTNHGEIITSNFNAGYPNVMKLWQKLSVFLPTALTGGSGLQIKLQDESGNESTYTVCDISSGGGPGGELLEYEFSTPFEAAEVSLYIRVDGPSTNTVRPYELGQITLEGYLKPEEEQVFDMELLCQDYKGIRGYEFSDFLFDLSDEGNFVLTNPNGTKYNVRMDADYPKEILRADENGKMQTVVRVRCRGTAV